MIDPNIAPIHATINDSVNNVPIFIVLSLEFCAQDFSFALHFDFHNLDILDTGL